MILKTQQYSAGLRVPFNQIKPHSPFAHNTTLCIKYDNRGIILDPSNQGVFIFKDNELVTPVTLEIKLLKP